MLRVRVRQDGQQETTYHFEKHEISVGKVHGLDIVLPSAEVSRHHARISWSGSVVTITDANSTAGTWQRIVGSKEGHFATMAVEICGYELSFEIVEAETKRPSSSKTPSAAATRNTPHELNEIPPAARPAPASGPATLPSAESLSAKETTGPSLRRLLDLRLRTTDEFDAFCLDYFPSVYKRFAPGMTRLAKQNYLLETERRELIEQALAEHQNYQQG
jgi:hypothetical protein